MGTYGDKRKGKRPQPPRSALDAFRMRVKGDWREIESELLRRKAVVEGPEMPPLAGMEGTVDSPRYEFECPTCPVGKVGNCELYVWDEEGNLIVAAEVQVEEEQDGTATATDNFSIDGLSLRPTGNDALHSTGTADLA
jgi:hypothetical protein